MRTTIDLPEAVLHCAEEQAARQGVDVNQFLVATIAREVGGMAGPMPGLPARRQRSPLPTIRGRGEGAIPNVTSELEARAQEEEDLASYRRSFGR